jgi:citrate lyase synthetase
MCPFVYHDQLFNVFLFAKKKNSHIYIAIIFKPVDRSREIILLESRNKNLAILFQRPFGAG